MARAAGSPPPRPPWPSTLSRSRWPGLFPKHGLAAGRAFYDHQSPGVGDYFFDSLFAEIDSLILYAGTHPIRHDHHRLLARRFPHAIYYKIASDEVIVHRVIDCRRDPKWIQRQLKRPPAP